VTREPTLGGSVRYWRQRRGYSQAQLAEIAGISITVVRKLEQQGGHRDGSPGVRLASLYALARALNVQTAQLFPMSIGPAPADQDPAQLALLPIRVALTPPLLATPDPGKQPPAQELPPLRRALAHCARLYDRDQYEQVAVQLPGLLTAAHRGAQGAAVAPVSSEILSIRSGIYQLAGWFLTQVGAHDLAYQAVRDALADGIACGDPLAGAACVIGECWLLIRQGRLLDAKRTAVATADLVEPRMRGADPGQLAVWGWLLLLAWAAAIRNNQEDEAREFLRAARSAGAGTAQERVRYDRYWSTLGPATVAMKEVEHEVITGNFRKALTLAGQIPPGQAARADSRQRHQLDLAAAHAGIGDRSQAIGIFTALRLSAPQWLRHQRAGRATARSLLSMPARTWPEDARALADFYDFGA
jgi:transcriptional regulator with XRE-family HTH domain